MGKTLLSNSIYCLTENDEANLMQVYSSESLSELVADMQEVFAKAEQQLLSPRREVIDRLLQEA